MSQPGSTTLTFEETAANETKRTLHHAGFPSEQSPVNHRGGWGVIVDTLAGELA